MLSSRFSAAHCVWFDRQDIEIMRQAGAQVVHNPASNLRLRSGIAPVREMRAAGINVAFGIDSLGMSDDEDIFEDMRLAYLVQNVSADGPVLSASDLLDMATRGGAQVTGIEGIGTLEVGNYADVILLSRADIEGVPSGQPLADLILKRCKPSHIRFVIIGGRTLIADGRWADRDPAEMVRRLGEERSADAARTGSIVARVKQRTAAYLQRHLPGRSG
jgi:5-methylthioadenosine/S-adenosylhomocysteine deaminase